MKNNKGEFEVVTLEESLSVEELTVISSKIAELVGERKALEEEKKASAKSYSDMIKSFDVRIEVAADEIRTAVRKVEVLCKKDKDSESGEWVFVDEQGVEVKREPILLEARQISIEDVAEDVGYEEE